MDSVQFIATVVVGLITAVIASAIAPIALHFQQKGQNARDLAMRQKDIDAEAEDAKSQAETKAREERREVYAAVLRAVSRYRASVADVMTHVESKAKDANTKGNPTRETWASIGPKLAVDELAAAQEAVAVARLWATRDVVSRISAVEHALGESAASALGTSMTNEEAWTRWESLRQAVEDFGSMAEADLRESTPSV